MEMSTSVSLQRTAQSLLTGQTISVAALLRFFIDVNLPFFLKQSLQTHFVWSCCNTYVFYAMYWGLYGDIISVRWLIFVWIKMANNAKKLKTSFWQNKRWQKHKSIWFDFVYHFAFKNRYWFKMFVLKIGTIFFNFVTLKWGLPYISSCSSPTISHSSLILVLYARQITVLCDFIIAGWVFCWKRKNYHFRKSCVSFAFKYIIQGLNLALANLLVVFPIEVSP